MVRPHGSHPDPPIQAIESIDIVGDRKDGGVDLIIVASSRLESSAVHQRLLLDKIASYLSQLNTPEFRAEFNDPPAESVRIVVACSEEPDPVIRQLIEKCQSWVIENNASLELEGNAL